MKHSPHWLLPLLLSLLISGHLAAQQNGVVTGQVTDENDIGIGGVSVVLNEAGQAQISDSRGNFRFDSVAPGSYTVNFGLGDRVDVVEGFQVAVGQNSLDHQVDWSVNFAETLTVTSASRRVERIVDAPAAVTVISAEEIEAVASGGQVPKLLEFTPGVEVTQGGLYDFNINTRGFNSSLNRRVAFLIDGRDGSVPFLASQEWTAASLPMDDIESLELVRGPSAALYGSNSSSGVINVTTKAPRGSEGTVIRLTGGELATTNADFRYATGLSETSYLKVLGAYRKGDTFTVSRAGAAEYTVPCAPGQATGCLPQERFAIRDNEVEGYAANLRFDQYFGDSLLLTAEASTASVEGGVVQTNIGRVLVQEIDRPWYRLNLSHPHFNVLASRSERDAPTQVALSSGNNLVLDSVRQGIEIQTNWDLGYSARIVVGASYREEDVDTFDPRTGRQTLMFQAVDDQQQAAFAQLDWNFTDDFKLVLAARYDDSDVFYNDEFSPKAALVYSITQNNSVRLTYNRGFQSPNYTEKFLQADVAAPVNLSPLEAFCSPFGVTCGFSNVRVLAVGNVNLGTEEVKAWELGYTGIFGGKAFFTADYYNTENQDFVTDLISTQATPLGDFNTQFGPYAPPAGLPTAAALLAALRNALGPTFFALSNNLDGTPIVAAVSYGTFGQVDTQGVDLGVNYYLNSNWTVAANYSWFDFEIKSSAAGLNDILAPNSPEHSVRSSVSYRGNSFDASLSGRWVDSFFWATGPFNGIVPSYETFDVSAGFDLNETVRLGINISNIFDNEHFEAFGGDLIGRRALGSVTFNF